MRCLVIGVVVLAAALRTGAIPSAPFVSVDPCWQPAPISYTNLTGILAFAGEGVASDGYDGKYFFFNAFGSMWKSLTASYEKVVMATVNVIPDDLEKQGYQHSGDTDYVSQTNALLVPLCKYPRGGDLQGVMVAVDADTLKVVPNWRCYVDWAVGAFPWIAVNNGVAYAANYFKAGHVFSYKLTPTGCDPLGNVTLSQHLVQTQGAVFVNDTLFIGTNDDCVYRVNITTGAVAAAFCRTSPQLQFEMEGLSYTDLRSQGMGQMHVQGGTTTPANVPRPFFHFEYVC